ncbi:hypothetical protein [Mesorhizobium sp. CA4]|uniref:hypothetical protein n=1 Tax=Mesorhizobium sp. CA4 TaxID=588499 RepID=UPI001CD04F71|nr:hypothetical protein [Mesorhizobium sp. CA4]MBZ9822309.1 hypothetical protein [Mesorhizobium sp. CA4]
MSDLESLRAARARLVEGEPIRILIGHVMHRSVEIRPAAGFMASLRAAFLCDIDEAIAVLTPPPDPAAPAGALPSSDERTA